MSERPITVNLGMGRFPRRHGPAGHYSLGQDQIIHYSFQVADRLYPGVWNVSKRDLVQPVRVRYDPHDPRRSTLVTVPLGRASRVLGWGALVLGLFGFVLGRALAPERRPKVSRESLPGWGPCTVFWGLVALETVCWLLWRAVPVGQITSIFVIDSYDLVLLLSVPVFLGLGLFWRPARLLHAIVWTFWVGVTLSGVVVVDELIGWVWGGAFFGLGSLVTVLSYTGLLGNAFKAPVGALQRLRL